MVDENSLSAVSQELMPHIIKFVNEYEDVSDSYVKLRLDNAKGLLNQIFNILSTTRKEKKLLNSETSFLFNFFDFFRVNENKMSEILAFLLDPKSSHGQSGTYFRIFCEHFGLPTMDISQSFYICCEKATDANRRIDILIKAGDCFIIVESKFRGAQDQKCQLEHYYEFISQKSKTENQVYLLYVKDGTEPSDYSLPKNGDAWKKLTISGNMRKISFKERHDSKHSIYKYLEACRDMTNSDKMRFFIEDLMQHISMENKMKKYSQSMFSWLAESPERTENAYEIYSKWNTYRKYIVVEFLKDFYSQLNIALVEKFKGLKAEPYNDFFKKPYSGYRVYIKEDYHVYIQSDSVDFDSIHYGLAPLHIESNSAKGQTDLYLRDKILANFPVQEGFGTGASIVKFVSKISDLKSIENFTKLLPASKEETISIWIDEVIALIKFVSGPDYLAINYGN
jgi:hypothetical protein